MSNLRDRIRNESSRLLWRFRICL